MASELRITVPLARVLQVFLTNPDERHYGYDLMERANLPSGSLYPILARLERAGWIEGAQEEIDPQAEGRPRRRYFTMTGDGIRLAEQQLARLRRELGAGRWAPGLSGLQDGVV